RVCMLVTTVAFATHVVFLPLISRAALESPNRVNEVLRRSLSLTSAVILPLTIGGIVAARPLLVFFFGSEYGAAHIAFSVLLGSIALLSIHGTLHNVFIAQHKTRNEATIFGAGALINMVLNLILIPRYGLTGAAFATLAAEAFILAASVLTLKRWGMKLEISRTLLPLGGSLVMGAAIAPLVERIPVWLLVPFGGLVYLVIFAAAGGFRRLRDVTIVASAAAD
ncbi:MAG: oligosaccharide flippase family protein, partial [Gemmatimonadales bacterium]